MIPVTKPFMPPRSEYNQYIKGIWDREYLTNNGELVQELENELNSYLDTEYLSYVSNGTIALQISIKVLQLEGEIITTPFSFVATTSSIVWENCTPVFIDVDPNTLNIDHQKIEGNISENTSAILATHVFGNPCDIEQIREIADQYDLKIIYDAAHCFGTEYKGRSIFKYGDISITSLHATKIYHTIEGGAIFTSEKELHQKINRMRNFGYAGPGKFKGLGINGKNSEMHAAMGLCNLKYISSILQKRKKQFNNYEHLFYGQQIKTPKVQQGTTLYNKAYFPVIFETEEMLLKAKRKLETANIFPRKYFYPSLNKLDYVEDAEVPHSESISKRILCLPLYHDLREYEQWVIADVMNETEGITA